MRAAGHQADVDARVCEPYDEIAADRSGAEDTYLHRITELLAIKER